MRAAAGRDDRVREGSDAVDFHADHVADLEVALADDVVSLEGLATDLGIGGPGGPARGSGLEDEAGLKRVEVREEATISATLQIIFAVEFDWRTSSLT